MYANAAYLSKVIAFKHFHPSRIKRLTLSHIIHFIVLLFYFLNMLIFNLLMLVSNKIK